jgi:ribosome-associated protein
VLKTFKLGEIAVLKVGKISSIADYFVICVSDNITLTKRIINEVIENMKQSSFFLYSKIDERESSWVILDYGDIVLHIFLENTLKKYDLIGLWGKVPKTYIYS